MDRVDGSFSEPGSPLLDVAAAAAAINASGTGGAELGVSGRTKLVLEIIMVLMCLGAVTGTDRSVDTLFNY